MNIINEFLSRNRSTRKKIACVGDGMVDEYHLVSVNRISPEFPMPIMTSKDRTPIRKPGGAANVANQFKYFNVDTQVVCFIDGLLEPVLHEHGLKYSVNGFEPHIGFENSHVPVKHRFLDGVVQVVRWDVERPCYGLNLKSLTAYQKSVHEYMFAKIKPDVVVLSDYDKGFFHGDDNWIDFFPDAITIVDPKNGPISKWQGCSIFKPNKKEAEQLTGLTKWKDQCKKLARELRCRAVVITDGSRGVHGIWDDELFDFMPCTEVEAMSVVGAGDCFVAGLAMAVAHGFQRDEAAEIAYQMGSQYVRHSFNRPITPAEMSVNKIVHPEDLANRDFRLVFTNGCFDLLTLGHVQCLEYARAQGEKLVVAVNSDESVKRLKGPDRPITPLNERMAVLAALESVDFVMSFDENTPLNIIKTCKPDLVVKGGDYHPSDVVGKEVCPVKIFPLVESQSTSGKIEIINYYHDASDIAEVVTAEEHTCNLGSCT